MKAKKLLALALALIMAISCMGISVFAYDVNIQTNPGDKVLTLDLEPDNTIQDLKEKLKEKYDLDSSVIHHLAFAQYNGLDDSKTLLDYGIQKESTLYLTLVTDTCPECFGTGKKDNETCTNCAGIGKLTYLDLDVSDTTYPDTKTVDQLYDATVTNGSNTNKTKVQVSWKLQTISVSVTANKVWNTETLTWDDDTTKNNCATAEDVTAEFDFVNLSSVKIDATVTFAVNTTAKFTDITPAFTDDGVADGDGVITLGTKADGDSADNDGNIKVAISPNAEDFKDKSGAGTYGTYTVTIDRVSYAISASMTNATAAETNPTKIKEDGTVTLVYTADATYALPESVTVTGATLVSWEKSTGTLVIKNPTGAVSVSGAATQNGFAITTNLSNATAYSGNPTVASQSGTTTLVFNADTTNNSLMLLPTDIKYTEVISVTGATVDSWALSNDGKTGTLVISNPTAAVSVTLVGGTKPVITTQPVGGYRDTIYNSIYNFSVIATGDKCTYQWFESEYGELGKKEGFTPTTWTLIINATSSSYTEDRGMETVQYFKCVVTNAYGSVDSESAYTYVDD